MTRALSQGGDKNLCYATAIIQIPTPPPVWFGVRVQKGYSDASYDGPSWEYGWLLVARLAAADGADGAGLTGNARCPRIGICHGGACDWGSDDQRLARPRPA